MLFTLSLTSLLSFSNAQSPLDRKYYLSFANVDNAGEICTSQALATNISVKPQGSTGTYYGYIPSLSYASLIAGPGSFSEEYSKYTATIENSSWSDTNLTFGLSAGSDEALPLVDFEDYQSYTNANIVYDECIPLYLLPKSDCHLYSLIPLNTYYSGPGPQQFYFTINNTIPRCNDDLE